MKKIAIIIFALCLSFYMTAQEQKNTELHLGLTTGIFGSTLFSGDDPMSITIPLYLGPTLIHKNLMIAPFYNVGDNSLGSFFAYQINDNFTPYLVVDVALEEELGIFGIGVMTPIINPYVQGFVEYTRSFGIVEEGGISIGVWVPLSRPIVNW